MPVRVFHRIEEIPGSLGHTSVAIGNFDGLHLGHAVLLRNMLDTAKKLSTTPSVLTFYPHPIEILHPKTQLERLTTTTEKLSILENLGVELVLVQTFDASLALLDCRRFFETFLQRGLRATSIHVGSNFRFGHNREGTVETLQVLAAPNKIQVQAVSPLELSNARVSSSRVREHIKKGEMKEARTLLGHPYFVTGQVKKGDERGRELGFPTANLRLPADKLLPRTGVYVTRAQWQRQTFGSVTNIGFRPTFHTEVSKRPVTEIHLLDFKLPLYDETIQVEFVARLRDEMKFSDQEALKNQIRKDIVQAERILQME